MSTPPNHGAANLWGACPFSFSGLGHSTRQFRRSQFEVLPVPPRDPTTSPPPTATAKEPHRQARVRQGTGAGRPAHGPGRSGSASVLEGVPPRIEVQRQSSGVGRKAPRSGDRAPVEGRAVVGDHRKGVREAVLGDGPDGAQGEPRLGEGVEKRLHVVRHESMADHLPTAERAIVAPVGHIHEHQLRADGIRDTVPDQGGRSGRELGTGPKGRGGRPNQAERAQAPREETEADQRKIRD